MQSIVQMSDIVKTYPGTLANDHVNFDLKKGEIQCLLGENGSGKTTLMNVLYGISQPDSGQILLNGSSVKIKSPLDAINNNIGMIHQHFMLVSPFTVIQNIIMGEKSPKEPFLDFQTAAEKINDISCSIGLPVKLKAKIWQLGVGDQQRVEIIKALYRGAKILIMDEPTSVLTPIETKELFQAIKKLTTDGLSVVFITHKLEEVMAISDRVTVLRQAKKVATIDTKDTNKKELANMMIGKEFIKNIYSKSVHYGKTVLDIKDLYVKNEMNIQSLNGISLSIREGEILGIAGVSGNGQEEIVDSILGVKNPEKGEIFINGKNSSLWKTRKIIKSGVSCIPFDRQNNGLVLELPIYESMMLKGWDELPFTKNYLLQENQIKNFTNTKLKEYDVVAQGASTKVSNLSGGNQQKVVLARELSSQPKLLLACNPTLGLDLGAAQFVLQKIIEARNEGSAVLFISTELEEVLSISDRTLVLFAGRIKGEVHQNSTMEEIGLMMAGSETTNLECD